MLILEINQAEALDLEEKWNGSNVVCVQFMIEITIFERKCLGLGGNDFRTSTAKRIDTGWAHRDAQGPYICLSSSEEDVG